MAAPPCRQARPAQSPERGACRPAGCSLPDNPRPRSPLAFLLGGAWGWWAAMISVPLVSLPDLSVTCASRRLRGARSAGRVPRWPNGPGSAWWGEASVGKTRLVAELTSRCAANGTRVLVGGCVWSAAGGPAVATVKTVKTVLRPTHQTTVALDAALLRREVELQGSPFRRRDHHSTHPTLHTHPLHAGAASLRSRLKRAATGRTMRRYAIGRARYRRGCVGVSCSSAPPSCRCWSIAWRPSSAARVGRSCWSAARPGSARRPSCGGSANSAANRRGSSGVPATRCSRPVRSGRSSVSPKGLGVSSRRSWSVGRCRTRW
jgi:hypothetical protein